MVTPATPPPAPGATFGPYRIDTVIATGRTGMLYVATDQRLGRQVALKVVVGNLAASSEFVERFQGEAATLARLESPHVVQVFDHGVQDGLPFIATQYAAGGDLGALLARLGPMPLPLAAQAASQVAEALRDAHRAGVVHRNLKPSNVLLRDDRLDRIHVLVCDFGVGPTEGSSVTEPASAPGAWNYLAPERLRGEPGSESADVYAVGCLLHEAVTGRPPFTGTDVEVAMAHMDGPVPQIPGTDDATQRLNRILTRALAKDPAQRYESASELRDDLRAFAGILSSPSSPSSPPVPAAAPPPPPPSDAAPTMAPTGPPPAFQSASFPPAPPYAGGPPSGPPGGPSGSKRNTKVVLVAAAAVLLLVIGIGVAVAVVSGDDDEPSADPTNDPTTAQTDPSTSGEPDPTDPTESTTETTEPDGPVEPDLSGPITGDIDGDGFGDVSLLTFDGLQTLPSDGTKLGDVVRRKNLSGTSAVLGDIDNDDKLDVVRLAGEPPRFSAVTSIAGAPISPLNTPANPDLISPLDYPVVLGDVSADGNLDLVVYTPLSDNKAQIDVALGDGKGGFARTETWFSGDAGETEGGSLFVVDADEDGTNDLVRVTFGRATDNSPQAILLTSDGSSAFTVTGQPTEVDAAGFAVGTVVAGDFDGDGDDDLMGTTADGLKASFWTWNGTTFDQTAWYDDSGNFEQQPINSSDVVVSDLNGDGFDDLVVVGASRNFVYYVNKAFVSDGTSLTLDESWRRPLDLEGDSTSIVLLGPVCNTKL